MLREIFSDVNPNTKFRKIAAIVLYVFFMLCIIYSNNKRGANTASNSQQVSTSVSQ